jgi:hypothetical protein
VSVPRPTGLVAARVGNNDASAAKGTVTELFGRKVREGGVDGTTRFDALSRPSSDDNGKDRSVSTFLGLGPTRRARGA